MNEHFLEDIGLTTAQARAYHALVERGGCSAPAIATAIGESRSNAYKVLDRLCELALATKDVTGSRVTYRPASPAALEQLVRTQAGIVARRERQLNDAMPAMLDFFFAHTKQPTIRFYQGRENLKQMYTTMLTTGKTLYLVRSPADVRFYDEAFFSDLLKKRSLLGIKTVALTPDVPSANHDPAADAKNKLLRTWIPADAYTANVEWNIAGNKVALISYEQEAIGVIIESAQIAESFRQLFALAQARARRQPPDREPGRRKD